MPYVILYHCDVCGQNLKAERCNSDGKNWMTLECLRSTEHEKIVEGSNALRLTHTHVFCSLACLAKWVPQAVMVEDELLKAVDKLPMGQVRGRFTSPHLKGVHLP